MAFESFEGAEYNDDMYEQLRLKEQETTYSETKQALGGLQKELSPYDVDAEGNYVAGAFDDINNGVGRKEIPEYQQDDFPQDAVA